MTLPQRICEVILKVLGPSPNLCDRIEALEQAQSADITVDRKRVLVGCAAIRSDADANSSANTFNASVTENSEGQWTITFGTDHAIPDGEFFFSVAGEEDGNRDNPKVTLVEGSDSSTGVQIMVTVDDNGVGADIYEDNDFSFIVYAECDVISQIYVNGDPVASNDVVDTGADGPTLPSADGKVVSDNFQDQQFIPFNLQVRNTTGTPVNWEAQVANVSYATIPSLQLNGATLVTADNGDGTYTHLFSGGPLAGFQNIIITGAVVDPVGDGSGLTLYCENA